MTWQTFHSEQPSLAGTGLSPAPLARLLAGAPCIGLVVTTTVTVTE